MDISKERLIVSEMQDLNSSPSWIEIGAEDCCGVFVTKEMWPHIKKGEIFYCIEDCPWWESSEYKNYRDRIEAGQIMMFVGPAIWYMGICCEVYESTNWLIGEQVKTVDFIPGKFVVLWTRDRILEYLRETNTGLSSLDFALHYDRRFKRGLYANISP